MDIPIDVKAYLLEASLEIAEKRGYSPSSEDMMNEWINEHLPEIASLASKKMWDLLTITSQPKHQEIVVRVISNAVYDRINNQLSGIT